MKNFLSILFITLFTQCGNILGGDDKSEILPQDLMGEWVRVVEVQSDVAGLYKKDSVIYRIGMDRIVDSIPYNVQDTMAFYAKSKYEANSITGFIYRSWDRYGKNNYDYDLDVPYILFDLRVRKNGAYENREIRFAYTRDFQTDTIDVMIESEKFGLKRRGL